MPEEGWRVSVYWPADKAWYAGDVKHVDEYGRSLVAYDDGQVEVLHFAVERFKVELAIPDSKGMHQNWLDDHAAVEDIIVCVHKQNV